jgi:transposase
MSKDTQVLFVGVDAHQETLSIAVLVGDSKEPLPPITIPNSPPLIRRHFRRLLEQGTVVATYEAGSLGFVLFRQLMDLGVQCVVAAPSHLPKIPGDHRKTDRLDAQRLALFLRAGQIVEVRPPTPQIEALRTLTHTREAMREDVVRARHRVLKLCLARGLVYRDGMNWSAKHLAWLRKLEMPIADDRQTLDFLVDELEHRLGALARLDLRMEERAKQPDIDEAVRSLRAFRGVKTLTALTVVAQIADPRRFKNAKQVASYCGLIPSEHSSGSKVRRGAITRSGNSRLRRMLVEATQHFARPFPDRSAVHRRRPEAPPKAQRIAARADTRLKVRYRKLAARKHTNLAKTAVARELIGFLWAALHPDFN